MKFRPCIDIHKGVVKQIIGSTLSFDGTNAIDNFVSDKSSDYYANMFKNDNLFGGHICMLGAKNEDSAIKALNEFKNGFQIGGGINETNAHKYLDNGASHVIVSSYLFENGEFNELNLKKILKSIDKKNLVIDLSCKKKENTLDYYVCIKNWTVMTNFKVNKENINYLATFCDEFLIHSTAVEGKKCGPDIELVKLLADCGCENKITYAGGIASFEDIILLKEYGKEKIDFTIGSALDIFGGPLSYKKIVENFK
ncbi:MAG: phosphoribosylformimino-5-aminoimidazole carboxamide ribotide isomerase [Oscillospiraceae bacterium]